MVADLVLDPSALLYQAAEEIRGPAATAARTSGRDGSLGDATHFGVEIDGGVLTQGLEGLAATGRGERCSCGASRVHVLEAAARPRWPPARWGVASGPGRRRATPRTCASAPSSDERIVSVRPSRATASAASARSRAPALPSSSMSTLVEDSLGRVERKPMAVELTPAWGSVAACPRDRTTSGTSNSASAETATRRVAESEEPRAERKIGSVPAFRTAPSPRSAVAGGRGRCPGRPPSTRGGPSDREGARAPRRRRRAPGRRRPRCARRCRRWLRGPGAWPATGTRSSGPTGRRRSAGAGARRRSRGHALVLPSARTAAARVFGLSLSAALRIACVARASSIMGKPASAASRIRSSGSATASTMTSRPSRYPKYETIRSEARRVRGSPDRACSSASRFVSRLPSDWTAADAACATRTSGSARRRKRAVTTDVFPDRASASHARARTAGSWSSRQATMSSTTTCSKPTRGRRRARRALSAPRRAARRRGVVVGADHPERARSRLRERSVHVEQLDELRHRDVVTEPSQRACERDLLGCACPREALADPGARGAGEYGGAKGIRHRTTRPERHLLVIREVDQRHRCGAHERIARLRERLSERRERGPLPRPPQRSRRLRGVQGIRPKHDEGLDGARIAAFARGHRWQETCGRSSCCGPRRARARRSRRRRCGPSPRWPPRRRCRRRDLLVRCTYLSPSRSFLRPTTWSASQMTGGSSLERKSSTIAGRTFALEAEIASTVAASLASLLRCDRRMSHREPIATSPSRARATTTARLTAQLGSSSSTSSAGRPSPPRRARDSTCSTRARSCADSESVATRGAVLIPSRPPVMPSSARPRRRRAGSWLAVSRPRAPRAP